MNQPSKPELQEQHAMKMRIPSLKFSLPAVPTLLASLVMAGVSAAADEDASRTQADQARLKAVIQFADNVLEHGRDRNGEMPTPLLADGVNVDTLQPVQWVYKGQEWIPSNLASHQNLFRTLVGLSNLTGDRRYKQAATEEIA
jgi:pectate lyase